MSAFEGQSDADIIAQQQASLDAKGTFQGKQKATAISDESNVTDAGLGEFETPRGVPQVSTGRTGQTGGGENPQNIPEDEGGRAGTGSSSVTFEGPGADKEDSRRQLAGALGTGNVSLKGDDPAARSVQDEVVASTDAPSQPQLQPQEENPYDA